MQRPIVLSIAGFDPSGGAGILADIKTFEQHKVYGMGVNTALTLQTENEFISIKWEKEESILRGLKMLMLHYNIAAVKIGIVQNCAVLRNIVKAIHKVDNGIKIIWDTVIKSSTGFAFWQDGVDTSLYEQTLSKIQLISPNYHEALQLVPSAKTSEDAALILSTYCTVLLKGGHNEKDPGVDYLYANGSVIRLEPYVENVFQKHGSGCVLSAAIAANTALGLDLLQACIMGKRYIEQFLNSNQTLLGYHHV